MKKIDKDLKTISMLDRVLSIMKSSKTYLILFVCTLIIASVLAYKNVKKEEKIGKLNEHIEYLFITNDMLVVITNDMQAVINLQSNKIYKLNEFSNSSVKLNEMANYKLSDNNADTFNNINYDFIFSLGGTNDKREITNSIDIDNNIQLSNSNE